MASCMRAWCLRVYSLGERQDATAMPKRLQHEWKIPSLAAFERPAAVRRLQAEGARPGPKEASLLKALALAVSASL